MRKRCKKDLVWSVVLKDAEVMKFMLKVCRTSWDLIYVSTAVYVHCRNIGLQVTTAILLGLTL